MASLDYNWWKSVVSTKNLNPCRQQPDNNMVGFSLCCRSHQHIVTVRGVSCSGDEAKCDYLHPRSAVEEGHWFILCVWTIKSVWPSYNFSDHAPFKSSKAWFSVKLLTGCLIQQCLNFSSSFWVCVCVCVSGWNMNVVALCESWILIIHWWEHIINGLVLPLQDNV